MDRHFSLKDGEPQLVGRYERSLKLLAGGLPQVSETLAVMMGDLMDRSFRHFNEDWINRDDHSVGGRYWPQIPTGQIIASFQEGMITAAKKGLGWARLDPDEARACFASELAADMTPEDLMPVVPRVTSWIALERGGTTFRVEAWRGPTAVHCVILTPGLESRLDAGRTGANAERLQDLAEENARLRRIVVEKELALDELVEKIPRYD